MKKIGLVFMAVLVGLCSCGKSDKQKLVGKWLPASDENDQRLEFTENSFVTKDGAFEYKIEDGVIKVPVYGTVLILADSFEFVDNDTLKLTGGYAPGTYKRVKTDPNLVGKWTLENDPNGVIEFTQTNLIEPKSRTDVAYSVQDTSIRILYKQGLRQEGVVTLFDAYELVDKDTLKLTKSSQTWTYKRVKQE